MATPKQISYILTLLHRCGYPTRHMNSDYKDFGATMRERRGYVEDWLRSKSGQPYKASGDPEVRQLQKAAGPEPEIAELRRIAGLESE